MVVVGENSVHVLKRTNANFATLGLRILIPLFFHKSPHESASLYFKDLQFQITPLHPVSVMSMTTQKPCGITCLLIFIP